MRKITTPVLLINCHNTSHAVTELLRRTSPRHTETRTAIQSRLADVVTAETSGECVYNAQRYDENSGGSVHTVGRHALPPLLLQHVAAVRDQRRKMCAYSYRKLTTLQQPVTLSSSGIAICDGLLIKSRIKNAATDVATNTSVYPSDDVLLSLV
jgi:hypothetical protein